MWQVSITTSAAREEAVAVLLEENISTPRRGLS